MENQKKRSKGSAVLTGLALLGLALVYFFQKVDYLTALLGIAGQTLRAGHEVIFIFNKTFRLVLNDLFCLLLIYALFEEAKYLRVAFWIFCFELFFVLPLYLVVKLNLEGSSEISSPLLSQIHRLIVNPMLMLLLIVAFYYQRRVSTTRDPESRI